MKCSVCAQDFSNAFKLWGVRDYNTFVVRADVFTAETLQLIFDFASINQIYELSIDTSQPEITSCPGCQLLNIRQRKERNKLLDLPEFHHLNMHDFF